VLTVLLYLWIPKGLFPTQDTGQLQARIETAQSVSLSRAWPSCSRRRRAHPGRPGRRA
jgi:multidrug efflux pump subunit AcrB